jgi:hypothetical protein
LGLFFYRFVAEYKILVLLSSKICQKTTIFLWAELCKKHEEKKTGQWCNQTTNKLLTGENTARTSTASRQIELILTPYIRM